ncbi:MAG: sulfate adenylyltransferase subunit 1, partial [Hyphomicrobiaceae bacterium]
MLKLGSRILGRGVVERGQRTETPDSDSQNLLRVMTCGSVDDGKSTLIGRLLYDLGQVFDDQLNALKEDSRKHGTTGDQTDLALLVDGLQAEREQGITIDVAYRYFATPRRKFIVADTPGHEQYTRNMATGASVSEVAIILVDALKGVVTQTRRHSAIAHLLGIRHIVVAINKMDLVDYSADRFAQIEESYRAFANKLGFEGIRCIPVVARAGDNIVHRSTNMSWYSGPTLQAHLDRVDARREETFSDMAMPVQWVNRPTSDFRGYSGSLASGTVRVGDSVVVLPAGKSSRVQRIFTSGRDSCAARMGDAVTLTLEDEIDVCRGDVIAATADRLEISDQFAGHLIWLCDEPMLPGRPYILKCGTQTVT